MQKKIISSLISALILSSVNQGYAANPATPITPATNTSSSINYNAGTANLDGNKDVIPPTSIPNPSVQNIAPNQPTAGLPQDAYVNKGKLDPVEATINLLNTPNAKIRSINRDLYKKGKVMNEPVTIPQKSLNSMIKANLSPGSVPPVIRLGKNKTTAIIMTDMTGQPWSIVNYDGLSEEDFTVKRLDNPAPDGYVLSITPKGGQVSGNLVLILKGLPSPVAIDFVSDQKVYDARAEVRVQGNGPNTQFTSVGLPDSLNTDLLSVLQGVAPTGSKELKVSSSGAQAWLAKNGSMYLRTRYKVMAPAFEHATSSPDGTYAYQMVAVPVVLYNAGEGRFGELAIDGF